MIHKDILSLNKSIQASAQKAIDEMNNDPDIRAAGYHIIVLETLRDLPVQMAYAVKARMVSLPEDSFSSLQWVQEFFKKAGLKWVPSADDNTRASTWTLSSKHIDGLAFDAAPSKNWTNIDWTAPDWIWERMAIIAESNGFKSGRRWKNKDSPHFEK